MTGARNQSSFIYTALQLLPALCDPNADHKKAWTFERTEGFAINCVKRHDGEYRWHVSWVVDGIDMMLDIHPANVLAVSVGPRIDDNSSRVTGRASKA